ncbi:GPI ethanolamine phosphate transferase 1 [Venturia nashicola]|uniref:GPI ethanolamine phosphate transferase 1 n=1 Tax=Venturia nashicola TaxID=86259 RepID=A0A4Z1NWG0_9PEZI|nr:GPI ethanolamine phosphate transferase 1 [Venturia nashicola]TLD32164.1 GPI ethanolamine phosphate transferase 1 [Venturia nashicola]
MARLGRLSFLGIAVVFHLIYVYSIFDIYFVSPIVHGMREFAVEAEAPAKRLVLYVGDGLRADKCFQSFPDPSPQNQNDPASVKPRPLTPFLRQKVLEEGTFGVSHTRVPTESRPGHVALIAGLYEDVSAVTTGWKLNPVNFDSVFNQSRHTWSWGSPDILLMFQEGAVEGRVDAFTYGAELEDFTSDAVQLDIWVFDRVKALFEEAKTNDTLNTALRQDKLVFFLHLLGLDTTGHGFRPYSKEYLHNIKVVDEGVKEITELIDTFYDDGKTAYVFTADHGMSDWGSHGDGHPDNTRTPLIAWGSGVAKPVKQVLGTASGHEDGFSSDWGFDQIQRNDVAQADVAALMAYLAGLAFPVNSVGELPLAYMGASLTAKAEALLVNAKGILEMYRVKEEQKKAKELRYRPYSGFSDATRSIEYRIAQIEQSIHRDRPEDAIEQCKELIHLGLQGLRYLQTYDWLFLRALVTAGFLGWIAFATTTVIDLHVLHGQTRDNRTTASNIAFSSMLVVLFSILFVQRSSWTYYAYGIFPVFFWEEVFARRSALVQGRNILFSNASSKKAQLGTTIKSVAFLGLLEALVQSYNHREIFTVCYLLAAAWPACYGLRFFRKNMALVATWALSCVSMGIFTLLPVVKTESINQIMLGGVLMLVVGTLYLFYEDSITEQPPSTKRAEAAEEKPLISRVVIGIQVGLVMLAIVVTRSSVASIQSKQGLPLGTQLVGWLTMIASVTVPVLHRLQPSNHYLHRLLIIFLTFSPMFIILTISYEGLFYVAFCVTLVTWVRLEHHMYKYTSSPKSSAKTKPNQAEEYRALTLADARISLFSLFLLQSAFFSTGNIASISSFSLDAVYRLIPVFDPFSQGALLVVKIIVPFAILSANLGILNRRLGVPPSSLFMIVMAIGDVMTIRFFWMVRDEGSWLDIGTSISHFCISSALCMFVSGLEVASEKLIEGVEFDDDEELVAVLEGTTRHENGNGNGKVL